MYESRFYLTLLAVLSFGLIPVQGAEVVVPGDNPANIESALVGDGPSLLDPNKRTGNIVKPMILDSPDARLFRPKMIWADSWQYQDLPILDDKGKIIPETANQQDQLTAAERIQKFLKVEKWYNCEGLPDLEGKCVMLEFSASWCPACRRAVVPIERWHEKYGEDFVIISIFETDTDQMDNFPQPGMGKTLKHYIGIDTQRRSANALGVYGIPHAVILEPKYGAVIWEGMTEQKGYQLTDEIIERIIAVGKKNQ